MGKFVGGAHHEALKGVLLRSRDQIVFFRLLVSVKLPLGEHSHLKFGGEQLPQGILDGGKIPAGDDIPFEGGGGVEDEAVPLQFHRSGVVKPGVDGGGGHLVLHQGQYFGPDISGWVHGTPPFLWIEIRRRKTGPGEGPPESGPLGRSRRHQKTADRITLYYIKKGTKSQGFGPYFIYKSICELWIWERKYTRYCE